MGRILIWDWFVRAFHWLTGAGFLAAAGITLVLGEDSPLFPYHAIIGLGVGALIALRIVWGVVGTRYARFGSFAFGPGAVAAYMAGVMTGRGSRHVGHNPGSAYAIFAMLALLAGIVGTGVMLGLGDEGVKEVHEWLTYAMLAVVAAHVLGVAVHSARFRENITASMIHGYKEAAGDEGIPSARGAVSAVLLVVAFAWVGGLLANYDSATMTTRVPLLGTELRLGEAEGEEADQPGEAGQSEADREEDSD